MRLRKNRLCKILLLILFMAFISGGCGGGSSGNSQGNNGNGNSNGNNGGQSAEINGTWEIVSGRGIISTDLLAGFYVTHLTYIPGKIGAIGVEVSPTPISTWGPNYNGAYCVTLTGEGLEEETIYEGTGTMMLYCITEEYPDREASPLMVFSGGMTFDYIGNNTYQDTEKTYAKYTGITQRFYDYESTLALEDSSTLRWTYQRIQYAGENHKTETWYEIVLKRAGSNYDPNDYTDNNTNTNNNNSNGNNNTSPTPNTNNNTAPDTPPQVNNTWKISSGSGLISQNISGRVYVSHLTYSPKKGDRGLEIDITQNDISTYYGEHVGLFSVTLTGGNVINGGAKGSGALRVSYSVAETPGSETSMTFTGGKTFSYIGGGTYRMTTSSGEHDITFADESTIKWKYTAFSVGWYEIVLTKE